MPLLLNRCHGGGGGRVYISLCALDSKVQLLRSKRDLLSRDVKKDSAQPEIIPIVPDSPKTDIDNEEIQRRRAEFFKKKGSKK